MKLKDYLEFLAKKPQTLTLTYTESRELCKDISQKTILEIPKEYHREIENLLTERLNSNAVDSDLVVSLEALLASLREE
jgi:hypothetical protein